MGKVLVTGANGYIAKHMVLALLDAGQDVIGVDNLSNSRAPEDFFDSLHVSFIRADIGDMAAMKDLFSLYQDIDAIIHFAGLIYVGESIEQPDLYYQANTLSAFNFFNLAFRQGIKNIVFSSSAGIYGEALSLPISEDHPHNPINPYGRSKLAMEWMLEDLARLYPDVNITMLRYFNVAGADIQQRTGQNSLKARHLIEVACEAALGIRSGMSIFGTDYDTIDGTCVRDYIHVNDLVNAHLAALKYNITRDVNGALALNCGYGQGYSNRQIIEAVKNVSGHHFSVTQAPRREGDPAALIAANDKILKTLDWTPEYNSIETIITSALNWKKKIMGL